MNLVVDGMTCGHCVRTVTAAIGRIAPDAAVTVDLGTGEVSISGNIDVATVVKTLGDEGYPVVAILTAADSPTPAARDRSACCGTCGQETSPAAS